MSRMPAPAEVLAKCGLAGPSTKIRELQAGLTNRSYRVDVDGRACILRLDTRHLATLGLDRTLEAEIQRRAARAGLAPAVLYADPAAGVLVYEYLPGRALTAGDLADTGTLAMIAQTLRAVHELPLCGRTLAVADAAARYAGIVEADVELHAFTRRCLEIVAAMPPPGRIRCCHNDVVAGNFIANDRLRLIDWEYACDNEPLFDLASLIGYHDLGAVQADSLLTAYAGTASREARERLALQCRLFDALQWLWLAAQQTLAPRTRQRDRLNELRRRIA